MRIISNFRDYYDSIKSYGIDKTCVYKREPSEHNIKFAIKTGSWRDHWPYYHSLKKEGHGKSVLELVEKRFIIGFCGKIYPVIVVEQRLDKKIVDKFAFYDTKSALAFVEKHRVEGRGYSSLVIDEMTSKKSLDAFFDSSRYDTVTSVFHRFYCPVFIYGRFDTKDSFKEKERLILNPILKDYGFGQIKDAATTFQDIFMYISGVLGIAAPEMVKISDKEMAKKRGHDSKYSFKKPPGKRGKKQWR